MLGVLRSVLVFAVCLAAFILPPVGSITEGRALWVGVACVVVAAAALYLFDHPRAVRRDREEKGQCVRCGYDITGNVSGTCPECGAAMP